MRIGLAVLCAMAMIPGTASAASVGAVAAGGASASPVPALTGVACVTGCVDLFAVQPTATLRLKGSNLGTVTEVVFLGGMGVGDDMSAIPARVSGTSVDVVVPANVAGGPLLVRAGSVASAPTAAAIFVGAPAAEQDVVGAPIAKVVADVPSSSLLGLSLAARTVYVAGAMPATLTVTPKGRAPVTLSVALVRVSDGTVVRRWTTPPVAPGARQAITWDGKVGKAVPDRTARYQFQVWATPSSSPATAMAAQAPDSAPVGAQTVELRPYAFPIAGRHAFGEGAARFGAGRDGHVHEGQDVFAACGTPLVAARGGTVRINDAHPAAGNYLVIDGDSTTQDMAYMHLRDPALPAVGEHVETGEVIGFVGDTGAASACHLHFELWTAPGWYRGGHAIDPLPALKSWDDEAFQPRRLVPSPGRAAR